MMVGSYPGAIADCRAALALDETHLKSRMRLAKCLLRVGKLEECIAEYRRVLVRDPVNAVALEVRPYGPARRGGMGVDGDCGRVRRRSRRR